MTAGQPDIAPVEPPSPPLSDVDLLARVIVNAIADGLLALVNLIVEPER